jgi:hypothetical protein
MISNEIIYNPVMVSGPGHLDQTDQTAKLLLRTVPELSCAEALALAKDLTARKKFLARQKKSWVDSGSGSFPSE